MFQWQRCGAKSAFYLLLWLLLLSLGKPSRSAEPLEILQLDKTLHWDQKHVGSVAFSPDGKTVAGSSAGWLDDLSLPGKLRLWTVVTGEPKLDMTVPGTKLMSIDFDHNGQKLFSGSIDGTVRIHNLRSLRTEAIPDAIGQEVKVSPNGTQFATTAGQVVRMVDVVSNKITATKHLKDALDIVPCPMAFSPDGKVIAIAREDRFRVKVYEVELCDPRNLNPIAVLRDDAPPVKTLSYSPNGVLLATGDEDGSVVIWDVDTMKQRGKTNALKALNSKGPAMVVFSPDGKLLGVAGIGVALLLKTNTLEVVSKIQGQGAFTMAFSPDGKHLLTSNSITLQGHETKLWKVGEIQSPEQSSTLMRETSR